jgi:hypothetical protein
MSSPGFSLIAREAEIINLLEEIRGSGLNYSVIGGYGVDAYSPLPRYSVDCDIVTEKEELKGFDGLLKAKGFDKVQTVHENELEGVQTMSYTKNMTEGSVAAELLLGGVRCRQTEAVWSAKEIFETSSERNVICVNRTVLSNVASREMLIALKLHSGRDTDRRDVVMLAEEADWDTVRSLCDRGDKTKLKGQLELAVAELRASSFGGTVKAAFGSKQSQDTRIAAAAIRISGLMKELV